MLDVKNRTFTTKEGVCLHLKRVSSLVIDRLAMDAEKTRPKPPTVDVQIGDHWVSQLNYDDPEYARLLALWQHKVEIDRAQFMLGVGIADAPPPDFISEHTELFPDATERELRSWWVTSFVSEEDELKALCSAIMGQTVATAEGVDAAAASFRGND